MHLEGERDSKEAKENKESKNGGGSSDSSDSLDSPHVMQTRLRHSLSRPTSDKLTSALILPIRRFQNEWVYPFTPSPYALLPHPEDLPVPGGGTLVPGDRDLDPGPLLLNFLGRTQRLVFRHADFARVFIRRRRHFLEHEQGALPPIAGQIVGVTFDKLGPQLRGGGGGHA